jgi:hypothetical protein
VNLEGVGSYLEQEVVRGALSGVLIDELDYCFRVELRGTKINVYRHLRLLKLLRLEFCHPLHDG